MPIKYYLQPNPITPDPNDQSARILPNRIIDLDGIIDEMLDKGTMVTRTDALAVVNLFISTIAKEIAEGNHVNTPLVTLRPSISGVFVDESDTFDSNRHLIYASVNEGTLLNEVVSKASLEKITHALPMPTLIKYEDAGSATNNSIVTPGNIGTVTGEELKFNPANAEDGIFFIAEDKTETKVITVASRTEGKLVFNVPTTLAAGNYKLVVRKAYTQAKTIRQGEFNYILKVL